MDSFNQMILDNQAEEMQPFNTNEAPMSRVTQ